MRAWVVVWPKRPDGRTNTVPRARVGGCLKSLSIVDNDSCSPCARGWMSLISKISENQSCSLCVRGWCILEEYSSMDRHCFPCVGGWCSILGESSSINSGVPRACVGGVRSGYTMEIHSMRVPRACVVSRRPYQ